MSQRLLPLTGVFFVLILDAVAKGWAERSLTPGAPVPVLDALLQWRLGYNTGIAFGLFATSGQAWAVLTGLIIAGLGAWFVRLLASPSPPIATLPLALLLGGGLANFLDRWPDGRVTDFLDLGLGTARWPTFNLADAAITLGLSVLAVATLHQGRLPGCAGGNNAPATAVPADGTRARRHGMAPRCRSAASAPLPHLARQAGERRGRSPRSCPIRIANRCRPRGEWRNSSSPRR